MSLKLKFALLLSVIVVSMAAMLGLSLWTISYIDSEVSGRLHSTDAILAGLNTLKRRSWEQAELLGASSFPTRRAPDDFDPPAEATRALFFAKSDDVERVLGDLEQLSDYYQRAGRTRTRALREGAELIRERGEFWFDHAASDDPVIAAEAAEALQTVSDELYNQHERIEVTEGAIIGDSRTFVDEGKPLRNGVSIVLVGAALFIGLACVLGVLLIRRWIFEPVNELRIAAARIGAGDYEHRIGMEGADEMATLAREVDEMAGLVKHMQDERVERERLAAVGEMVQRIVHNIRGPLGGIRNIAEVVERAPDRDELVRDSMTRVKATVDRFDAWVNDLLNATRPVVVEPATVNVPSWLNSIVDANRPAAESAGVELQVDAAAPAAAVFDPQHLEHALVAVIVNAIQATPRGGRVQVASSNGDARSWRITVEDGGPGVDPDVASRIFRPYFTTKHGGSGIGLAHARRIVEQHAGRIWAENVEAPSSEPQQTIGARFVLELPDKLPPASDK